MELWQLILLSLSFCTVLCSLLFNNKKKRRLPPGPPAVPILGNLLFFKRSGVEFEPILRELSAKYGPIITLRIGSRISIFVNDSEIAHKALIEHGAIFANRPAPPPATRYLSGNQHNITSSPYGPLWRLLRRNLMTEILHHSRVKIYGEGRAWVLGVLSRGIHAQAESGDGIVHVMENFQFAMFCLLVLMCFGEKLDEKAIREIQTTQREMLIYASKNNSTFAFFPRIAKYLFRKRWNTIFQMLERKKKVYAPLIQARRDHRKKQGGSQRDDQQRYVYSYLDSLLDIELPEEGGRKLTDDETVVLCSEFLNAGTDTTSTALQWIMANLVKHQDIQAKLAQEIDNVAGGGVDEIKEEDLQKMPYLKAVIMEGLRRHPPAHFVLPHAVTEEISIEGYDIPKGASINFMVAEIGLDEKAWEEPKEFKPERFLAGGSAEEVDITGSREIKMMPFGAGRRICPALGLAMLHLEYFVANLVREFEWKPVDAGQEIDLSEKSEFTVVMKNPLRARVLPRMTV